MVIVVLGGGYGSSMFEHLRSNGLECVGHEGASASTRSTKDGKLKFRNLRSEVIWRFREALDPDQPGGSWISLPDDPILLADLAAPGLDLSFNGLAVESKEDVYARLGPSTNHGDAVVMAWSAGVKMIAPDAAFGPEQGNAHRTMRDRSPVVVLHRPGPYRRR